MPAEQLFRATFKHDMHLSLRDSKQLAVQIILARTLQIPIRSTDPKLNRNVDKIVNKIRDLAKPDLDQDEVGLADFLANLPRQLRRFVKSWRFAKRGEERRHIARFMRETRFLKLTPIPPLQEVLWLGEVFVWLVAIAEKNYAPALQGNGGNGLALRLRTIPQDETELAGETQFNLVNDAAASRAADVGIKLPLQHFCDDHFCQLPFTMFHEIFVHAPQAWETDGCRKIIGEHCALREGFVDAAAHAALDAELKTAVLPRLLQPFHEEVRYGIREAHRQRSATARVPDTPDERYDLERMVRKFRKLGRVTFEELAERTPSAMQLALCLNLLELPDKDDGSRLVDRLDQAIHRPAPPTGKIVRDSSARWLDKLCRAAAIYDIAKVRALVDKALSDPFQGDSPQVDPTRAFID